MGDRLLHKTFQMQQELYRYVGPREELLPREYNQASYEERRKEKQQNVRAEALLSKRLRSQALAPSLLPVSLPQYDPMHDTKKSIYQMMPPYASKADADDEEALPELSINCSEPNQPIATSNNIMHKLQNDINSVRHGIASKNKDLNSHAAAKIPNLVKPSQLSLIYDRSTSKDHSQLGGAPPNRENSTPTQPQSYEFLHFDTLFESGNLERVEKVLCSQSIDRETHTAHIEEYYVTLTNDPLKQCFNGTSGESKAPSATSAHSNILHNQWFLFRIRNMKPSVIYKFKIINMTQPKSSFENGMKPVMFSANNYEQNGVGWSRVGDDIEYYPTINATPNVVASDTVVDDCDELYEPSVGPSGVKGGEPLETVPAATSTNPSMANPPRTSKPNSSNSGRRSKTTKSNPLSIGSVGRPSSVANKTRLRKVEERPSSVPNQQLYTLAFTLTFPHSTAARSTANDTVYLAYAIPYTYTQLQRTIEDLTLDPIRSHHLKCRSLCMTEGGNRCDLLLITENKNPQITLPDVMCPLPPTFEESDSEEEVGMEVEGGGSGTRSRTSSRARSRAVSECVEGVNDIEAFKLKNIRKIASSLIREGRDGNDKNGETMNVPVVRDHRAGIHPSSKMFAIKYLQDKSRRIKEAQEKKAHGIRRDNRNKSVLMASSKVNNPVNANQSHGSSMGSFSLKAPPTFGINYPNASGDGSVNPEENETGSEVRDSMVCNSDNFPGTGGMSHQQCNKERFISHEEKVYRWEMRNFLLATRKPVILITCRVHGADTVSSYVCEGVIKFLLSDHVNAMQLRRNFVFMIVPMLNPDGVVNGYSKATNSGDDLSECWTDPHIFKQAPIYHLKQLMHDLSLKGNNRLVCSLNIQGHSFKEGMFFSGCPVYPKMAVATMEKNKNPSHSLSSGGGMSNSEAPPGASNSGIGGKLQGIDDSVDVDNHSASVVSALSLDIFPDQEHRDGHGIASDCIGMKMQPGVRLEMDSVVSDEDVEVQIRELDYDVTKVHRYVSVVKSEARQKRDGVGADLKLAANKAAAGGYTMPNSIVAESRHGEGNAPPQIALTSKIYTEIRKSINTQALIDETATISSTGLVSSKNNNLVAREHCSISLPRAMALEVYGKNGSDYPVDDDDEYEAKLYKPDYSYFNYTASKWSNIGQYVTWHDLKLSHSYTIHCSFFRSASEAPAVADQNGSSNSSNPVNAAYHLDIVDYKRFGRDLCIGINNLFTPICEKVIEQEISDYMYYLTGTKMKIDFAQLDLVPFTSYRDRMATRDSKNRRFAFNYNDKFPDGMLDKLQAYYNSLRPDGSFSESDESEIDPDLFEISSDESTEIDSLDIEERTERFSTYDRSHYLNENKKKHRLTQKAKILEAKKETGHLEQFNDSLLSTETVEKLDVDNEGLSVHPSMDLGSVSQIESKPLGSSVSSCTAVREKPAKSPEKRFQREDMDDVYRYYSRLFLNPYYKSAVDGYSKASTIELNLTFPDDDSDDELAFSPVSSSKQTRDDAKHASRVQTATLPPSLKLRPPGEMDDAMLLLYAPPKSAGNSPRPGTGSGFSSTSRPGRPPSAAEPFHPINEKIKQNATHLNQRVRNYIAAKGKSKWQLLKQEINNNASIENNKCRGSVMSHSEHMANKKLREKWEDAIEVAKKAQKRGLQLDAARRNGAKGLSQRDTDCGLSMTPNLSISASISSVDMHSFFPDNATAANVDDSNDHPESQVIFVSKPKTQTVKHSLICDDDPESPEVILIPRKRTEMPTSPSEAAYRGKSLVRKRRTKIVYDAQDSDGSVGLEWTKEYYGSCRDSKLIRNPIGNRGSLLAVNNNINKKAADEPFSELKPEVGQQLNEAPAAPDEGETPLHNINASNLDQPIDQVIDKTKGSSNAAAEELVVGQAPLSQIGENSIELNTSSLVSAQSVASGTSGGPSAVHVVLPQVSIISEPHESEENGVLSALQDELGGNLINTVREAGVDKRVLCTSPPSVLNTRAHTANIIANAGVEMVRGEMSRPATVSGTVHGYEKPLDSGSDRPGSTRNVTFQEGLVSPPTPLSSRSNIPSSKSGNASSRPGSSCAVTSVSALGAVEDTAAVIYNSGLAGAYFRKRGPAIRSDFRQVIDDSNSARIFGGDLSCKHNTKSARPTHQVLSVGTIDVHLDLKPMPIKEGASDSDGELETKERSGVGLAAPPSIPNRNSGGRYSANIAVRNVRSQEVNNKIDSRSKVSSPRKRSPSPTNPGMLLSVDDTDSSEVMDTSLVEVPQLEIPVRAPEYGTVQDSNLLVNGKMVGVARPTSSTAARSTSVSPTFKKGFVVAYKYDDLIPTPAPSSEAYASANAMHDLNEVDHLNKDAPKAVINLELECPPKSTPQHKLRPKCAARPEINSGNNGKRNPKAERVQLTASWAKEYFANTNVEGSNATKTDNSASYSIVKDGVPVNKFEKIQTDLGAKFSFNRQNPNPLLEQPKTNENPMLLQRNMVTINNLGQDISGNIEDMEVAPAADPPSVPLSVNVTNDSNESDGVNSFTDSLDTPRVTLKKSHRNSADGNSKTRTRSVLNSIGSPASDNSTTTSAAHTPRLDVYLPKYENSPSFDGLTLTAMQVQKESNKVEDVSIANAPCEEVVNTTAGRVKGVLETDPSEQFKTNEEASEMTCQETDVHMVAFKESAQLGEDLPDSVMIDDTAGGMIAVPPSNPKPSIGAPRSGVVTTISSADSALTNTMAKVEDALEGCGGIDSTAVKSDVNSAMKECTGEPLPEENTSTSVSKRPLIASVPQLNQKSNAVRNRLYAPKERTVSSRGSSRGGAGSRGKEQVDGEGIVLNFDAHKHQVSTLDSFLSLQNKHSEKLKIENEHMRLNRRKNGLGLAGEGGDAKNVISLGNENQNRPPNRSRKPIHPARVAGNALLYQLVALSKQGVDAESRSDDNTTDPNRNNSRSTIEHSSVSGSGTIAAGEYVYEPIDPLDVKNSSARSTAFPCTNQQENLNTKRYRNSRQIASGKNRKNNSSAISKLIPSVDSMFHIARNTLLSEPLPDDAWDTPYFPV